AQSRIFEEALRKINIPYKIYGGLSFYQRREIKDLLAYFRMIINPADNEALKRIINYPARGIGQTTLSKLEKAAVTNETSIWKIITALPEVNHANLNRGTSAKILNFVSLIEQFNKLAQEAEAFDTAKSIAEQTGILKELYNDKSPEGLSRHENIQELLNGIQEFSLTAKEEGLPDKLGNYLEDVALLTDQDNEKDEDRNKVTLMTVHSAKGLEFKNVFVVGLEENLFPSNQSGENKPEALEEERRLFYVALTRAKENAWLSFANQRYRWGNLDFCTPSRFLEEVDEKFLDNNNFKNLSTSSGQQNDDFVFDRPKQRFARRQPPSAFKTRDSQNIFNKKLVSLKETGEKQSSFIGDDPAKIQPGMVVEHQRFGEGKVLKVEGIPPNIKATVFFQTAGQKQLLLKFAKLKIKG
ncbi:MAG: 3'-5' exonuclease, partial [Bacteroidota bacterium]